MEGLAVVDDPDEQYEIVDVGEYFGGKDFDTADTIVLSQLKYSTRHPTKLWTAARLTEKRSRRSNDPAASQPARSLIADLANTYKLLAARPDRDVVLRKTRIQLVSNQPVDPLVTATVTAAAEWVRNQNGAPLQQADLRSALSSTQTAVFDKFHEAVGQRLTSSEFCGFFTVLDFSQTGVLSRTAQARAVRDGAADLAPERARDTSLRLFNLVREQALPGADRQGIIASTVLAELGVGDLSALYPAPLRLAELQDPLPAPGARAVADTALSNLGHVVVAHGPAGAGKTTALRQINSHLPAGSTTLLYDCYGGGDYLSTGEERHTPHRFVVQVVNDLAQQCGTPLLLHPHTLEEDLWRRLSDILAKAVATLDPAAVLVLTIDAADNAAVAALERHGSSFLPGLLGLKLPPQVAVVLSSRSHRVTMLGAVGAPEVAVVPFNAETSAAHLRRHRPGASVTDVVTFHRATDGNPRAQFYALEQADSNIWDMATLLEACDRTPEALFADIVDSALKGSGADADGQRWLAALLALSRPVSTRTLAQALDVAPAAVSAFADGLAPGVRVINDGIQFRDEDFETYVRDKVPAADIVTAHSRLADLFLATCSEDADAAAHVADHLFSAERHHELLQLFLREMSPHGIPDGLRREGVQGRRLALALLAVAVVDDSATAVRVAARACDSTSRMDTLSQLVESHMDLVARYTDIDLLRTHTLRQNHLPWLGPAHMRLAAALSRSPDRHSAAREELGHVDSWIQRWSTGGEDTDQWDLEPDHAAAAAEAYFRLDGPDAALAWVRRCRPMSFVLNVAECLAARVAGELGSNVVRSALQEARIPTRVHAPFLAYAASPSVAPAKDWVDAVISTLVAVPLDEPRPWHARLLDVATRFGDRQLAQELANRWSGSLSESLWAFDTAGADDVMILRCHATAAALAGGVLDVDALIPDSLRTPDGVNEHSDHSRAHRRSEWLDRIRLLADIAVLATRAVAGNPVQDDVSAHVRDGLAGRNTAAGHRWFKFDLSFRTWSVLAAEAVADAGCPDDLLDGLADAAPNLLGDNAPAMWLDLAEVLAVRPGHATRAIDLCVRAADAVRTGRLPAPDRLELLVRATDIAGKQNLEIGYYLFARAVDVATGINDAAARLLAVHADLARRAELPAGDRPRTAARLLRAAEVVAHYVTDPDVVPYRDLAGAATHLDLDTGFAGVCRWDDQSRIALSRTASAAVLGAVDSTELPVTEALHLDHFVEDNDLRLSFRLVMVDRLPSGMAGALARRAALTETARWLRLHVPARDQPALAAKLLHKAGPLLDATARDEITQVQTLERQVKQNYSRRRRRDGYTPEIQELLDSPHRRTWTSLHDDVESLLRAYVYGDQLRAFVSAVLLTTPSTQRPEALGVLATLPGSSSANIALSVLAELAQKWKAWPGVTEQARSLLPALIAQHLTSLMSHWDGSTMLVEQLRALADDNTIRRAFLAALPDTAAYLTAHRWQNVAAVLGALCTPADAASALVQLLDDRDPDDVVPAQGSSAMEPLVMMLWSAFGHPRRSVRWRAAHTVRDLLATTDRSRAVNLVDQLVGCLELTDIGHYRDADLHFYRWSAMAALLAALGRVAADKPDLFVPHLDTLTRIATSRELPHAQIRQLARAVALVAARQLGAIPNELEHANQPLTHDGQQHGHHWPDRLTSEHLRYRFDQMDTIPYWYEPLARVFDIPVDTVAKRAEQWIVDRQRLGNDDWRNDSRELRDERTAGSMSHRQGSIPRVESLRLYLEYHAMMVAAGELVDAEQPAISDSDMDERDPWGEWLTDALPLSTSTWLADLRHPVPLETGLFGDAMALDAWLDPEPTDYDSDLGLADGQLPENVVVSAYIDLHRADGYETRWVSSALVTPDHAADLQRALSATSNPRDFKLPTEGEKGFEVDHGRFGLHGWLIDSDHTPTTLDEHDAYAHDLRKGRKLPGLSFRENAAVLPDPSGFLLLNASREVVSAAEQWADPHTDDEHEVTSSGYRTRVCRTELLRYLRDTGTNLIVEVQIGRQRRSRSSSDGYRIPRSRIYLIDPDGRVTAH
ncbi:NACHT domain-containing protein [Umezawaea sp. Da 62-37]|uniref:NACHT domain-containing protein n=1 Tax=Umezawaea sp. Da 62-37 TaxID=3075927 RepID=UPI0028F74460|nr:NACHT domain-containing protein [Umezawaea sp. Da 62-37]WNV82878.1 NACHT domain-containing protein [Umezawaea sp. Da 62-37]